MDKRDKRFAQILDLINQNSDQVTIEHFCTELGVSPATVRRDLAHLQETGMIMRVSGGAVRIEPVSAATSVSDSHGVPTEQESDILIEEKRRIAQAAVALIEPGDTVFIDGGTTNLEIARKIAELSHVSVITTSIQAAYILSANPEISVIVCGGHMREIEAAESTIAPLAEKVIAHFRANMCFLSTLGIHTKNGITTPYLFTAQLKRLMMQSSAKSVLVTDHTKFGKTYSAFVCPVEQFDYIITGASSPEDDVAALQAKGVSVVLV
ncbi:DeoR/GlpR family DNA-binding transcription regulator [Paenibacillus qinlingensis]|uniref:DeoR/GlpR family transcriptional regulator of sugar metabolism n=1 Tax=Paenibacillus qinlingensis TaxID=1837343 RepID=A0ABU1P118_9BACL|nr:DeoR/GlpR family DNA-binding transcription regulator [Paenibacillus qinlingensis]MDR6553443.1 DeoR/GlpR family transcriptional regulator of sugar metabolism [Paenibacillus qinlingensis]